MKNKNKHPQSNDIHRQAFNAGAERVLTARRRGFAFKRAATALGLLTIFGAGIAHEHHTPNLEVGTVAAVGFTAAKKLETAKKGQRRLMNEAGTYADAAAANRINAAGLRHEQPPHWATAHIESANRIAALPLGNLAAAHTIEHQGVRLSADGTVTPIRASHTSPPKAA